MSQRHLILEDGANVETVTVRKIATNAEKAGRGALTSVAGVGIVAHSIMVNKEWEYGQDRNEAT